MAFQDKRQSNKLPSWADRDRVPGQRLDAATYIGIVKDNVDPLRSGRLQVWIPEFSGFQDNTSKDNPGYWRTVSYASPYFGTTNPGTSTNNDFEHTNQTYGMWMVPPDIGNQVLCTFVNGDPNRGYWFACISPTLSHYMVPGMAAGNKLDTNMVGANVKPSLVSGISPPQSLPVNEYNENAPDANKGSFYENPKPIQEWQAQILFKQGLDRDNIRGTISSSSQRESPSHVFGISTPGRAFGNDPADDPNYQDKLYAGTISSDQYAVHTRKGGHQFVMDDGDVMGKDQLVRLRSSGGHQILMHDTTKTMYIANSEGSVWIELTESGHMHIYTAGGFNLRSEGDVNVHGKNIRMQAEKDFNISAGGGYNVSAADVRLTGINSSLLFGGKINIASDSSIAIGSSSLVVSASGAIVINGDTVDINNGGSASNSVGPAVIKPTLHDDTTYNPTNPLRPNLWVPVSQSTSSIVTVLPSHEPWTRDSSTTGPAPVKSVESSICPPKSGTPGFSNTSGSTFKGGAGPLGDWIAQNETGSLGAPGGYNAFNRGGPAAPGTGSIGGEKLDLINLTLSQLQAKQSITDAYQRVFAAGRYQVIPSTLTAAVQGLKLDGNQKFDQTTQDYIFNNYLCRAKRKQIAAYLDNPDSNNQQLLTAACLDIAQEWASIATPPGVQLRNGKVSTGVESYYAGIGGNSAHGSVANTVAALKAQWQYLKDQASGSNTDMVNTPAQGGTLTDGLNNAVDTEESSNSTDVGIINAAGGTVSDSCPTEWLAKSEAYTPSGGIGSGAPTITQQQAKAMHAELGYFESEWDYSKFEGGRLGKYQVDAEYLAAGDRGYIKPDAVQQYGDEALANSVSWTGKDGINSQTAFSQYKNTQDSIQFDEFNANFSALKSNGGIKDTDDICIAAGMLFVAHQMRSADKAKMWREHGGVKDDTGVLGDVYFNHGRYAIDVLAASAAVGNSGSNGSGTASGLSGENTSGVNPDDVFTFTSGSGSRSSFDQLAGDFKTAVCKLAESYKTKTGSKIQVTSCFRSQADQDRLYQAWTNAGGKIPGMPKVTIPGMGGITTPAKLVGAHGSGLAMDSGQMAVVINTVGAAEIAKLGLKWGGTFSTPDPVHVQSMNTSPQPISPPNKPILDE